MKRYRGIIFLALIVAVYYGCKKAPVFPNTPTLKFKEFLQHHGSDSLQVVFSFTDGDGDIGVAPTDTNYNMLLTVYHKNIPGHLPPWIFVPDPNSATGTDSLKYKYRIPKLTAGQNGLEGDIYITLNKGLLINIDDSLEFSAFLIDQSHHHSDTIRTPEVDLIP